MTIVNTALNAIFSAVLLPFRSLEPGIGLTVISFLSGILFLMLFKKTSNQKAIKSIRDQMRASIFEIRIFQHDIGLVFRAQGRILLQTAVYLRYSLVPIVFICVPLIIIAIHCNLYFGYRPLREGEAAIVSVQMKEGTASGTASDVFLETPPEVTVETPPIFLESLNRIEWRVRAKKGGNYRITLRTRNLKYEKYLAVGNRLLRLSPVKPARGILSQLANPAEPPLPADSPVKYIKLGYPARNGAFFGWNVHWLIPFFILTLIFGFAFKGMMRVEI
ncbi:MAG: hypothetical protein ABIH66_13450 [bacterium]